MARDRERKGSFGPQRLPVTRRYLWPVSRRPLMLLGIVAALGILALILGDVTWDDGRLLSGGALSSSHAALQNDCASCHDPFEGVTVQNCSSCHEKYGDRLAVYGFPAHYLYRSNDFGRVGEQAHEMACSACHVEHQGRDASITRIDDGPCLQCHEFGAFGENHLPFDTSEEEVGLIFPHVHHVQELMERRGWLDPERACLECHEPQEDGRHFQPMDFDRHCSACHLTGLGTPRLSIAEAGVVGVEPLESIQQRGGPEAQWALFANPGEFRRAGRRLSKTPIHHADPWILDNLRRLRRQLYPEAGLADLLVTDAYVPEHATVELYEEAIDSLEGQIHSLRSQPETAVQEELDHLGALLDRVEQRLRDPLAPLDEEAFFRGLDVEREDLDPEVVESIEELVADLTQACQECHFVDRATIARVQKDQQSFRRAEFDHRAHVLDRRCLDCHNQIPIAQALVDPEVDLSLDRAEVRNLPAAESCQECHAPQRVTNQCVTCHVFHPNKNHTRLLRYAD